MIKMFFIVEVDNDDKMKIIWITLQIVKATIWIQNVYYFCNDTFSACIGIEHTKINVYAWSVIHITDYSDAPILYLWKPVILLKTYIIGFHKYISASL